MPKRACLSPPLPLHRHIGKNVHCLGMHTGPHLSVSVCAADLLMYRVLYPIGPTLRLPEEG